MTGAAAAIGFGPVTSGGGGGAGGSFSCSIPTGPVAASGSGGTWTFGAVFCTVVGGTGPFTYAWTETDDGYATWHTGTGPSFAPNCSSAVVGQTSYATYVCTVTDTSNGHTSVSNNAFYSYMRTVPGGGGGGGTQL